MRVSWWMVMPFFGVVAAPSSIGPALTRRMEVRVELLANSVGGSVESCDVVQAGDVGSPLSFASWSTVDEKAAHCGAGPFPDDTTAFTGTAPSWIHEVTAVVGWEAGAMDPGPLGAVKVFLALTSRQRTGVSSEGKPVYGAPVIERRSTRLEPGEEFVVPLRLDAGERETLGVHEALLRVRAGWAGREGATEYGALAVAEAAPGSEVLLDGGVAGRAATDGGLRLSSVPVGLREVRIRSTSGAVVTRWASVVKGRTVVAAFGAVDGGSAPHPIFTPTGKNEDGFQEYKRTRDGALMIHVPEGEFLMGNLKTEGAPLPHTVYVSSFLMDKLPLTVARYQRFAAATGRPLPPDPYWGVHDEFPVAFVRWDEAKAYCEWAGGRLPTEAEREKAARGSDGRMFPWGSDPPGPDRAVFGRTWGEEGNDAVGIRPAGASPYGLLDAEGNMWESCEDWWDPDYYKSSPQKDPLGPRTGWARVVRGGSWDSRWVALSASSRNFAYIGYREGDFGFRCAADPPRR